MHFMLMLQAGEEHLLTDAMQVGQEAPQDPGHGGVPAAAGAGRRGLPPGSHAAHPRPHGIRKGPSRSSCSSSAAAIVLLHTLIDPHLTTYLIDDASLLDARSATPDNQIK
jgi:hypothetical protein